ncbi:MAG: hypothetical protein KatS3mg012_2526 [Gaiellaceae bacterium]|jgi:hypothetical protein|nr:MAG: hypothetical protein KatS3mg012_2526 [Gaiellaceae bacterium]
MPQNERRPATDQVATWEPETLLAELNYARELFAKADRRARTFLAERGVIDQADRDLVSLLRACCDASSAAPESGQSSLGSGPERSDSAESAP